MGTTKATKRYSGCVAGALLVMWAVPGSGVEQAIGFEDLLRSVPPLEAYGGPGGGAYYNGSDGAGGFTSNGIFFGSDYNADWMSWTGWAYSTTTDTVTADFGNQYSAFAGGAADGDVYAVTFAPSVLELPAGYRHPVSVKVTNTTYAALSMRDGDLFAKKFGDDPSTDDIIETDFPDWYQLTISGKSEAGVEVGSVDVMLADFRGEAASDFIADEWIEVDLTPLYTSNWNSGALAPGIKTLEFILESSDVGDFGMNTPAYFALDNLVISETGAWGPYDLALGSTVNTGAWLGWVQVEDPWVFSYSLDRWIYLPGDSIDAEAGAWTFVPKP